MSTEATETQEGVKDPLVEAVVEPMYSIELEDEEVQNVRKSVVESNKGKAEDELTKEIEEATKSALDAKKVEAAPVLAKMEELAKLKENEGKTETELLELASAVIAESTEEASDDEGIGADFFGTAKTVTPESVNGTAAKTFELPEDVKAKVAKYDAIENDVVYKAYLQAKENNADIDLVDLIIQSGLTNNPEKITDPVYFKNVELYQMKQEDPSITDEEIEDFLEDFKVKSKIAQWNEVKGIKDAMTSEYRNAKAVLATKVASNVGASKESTQQIVAEAESELKNYGGVFRSVKLTEAQISKVTNTIRSGNVAVIKDGKVDVAKTVELVLKDTLEHDVVNAAYLRGKRDAERKATVRSGKPLRGIKVRSSVPKSSHVNPRDAFNKAKAEAWESQGFKAN